MGNRPQQPRIAGVPLKSRPAPLHQPRAGSRSGCAGCSRSFVGTASTRSSLPTSPDLRRPRGLPQVRVEALDDTVRGAVGPLRRSGAWCHPVPSCRLEARWSSAASGSTAISCRPDAPAASPGAAPGPRLSPLFGNRLISGAYGLYGGPVARDDASLEALNRAAEQLALDLGGRLPGVPAAPALEPALGAQFRSLRDLPQAACAGPDANFCAVPRKRRAMIRKALARGLEDRAGSGYRPLLFGLRAQRPTMHGTPAYPRPTSGARGHVRLGLRDPDGRGRQQPLASVLSSLFPRRGAALFRRRRRARGGAVRRAT